MFVLHHPALAEAFALEVKDAEYTEAVKAIGNLNSTVTDVIFPHCYLQMAI